MPAKEPRAMLHVSYALDATGAPVTASDEALHRGRRCDCSCPGCHAPLVLKRGPVKRAHFAHDVGYTPDYGCLESSTHLAYKHALAQTVGQSLTLPPTPEPDAQGTGDGQMDPTFTVHQAIVERRFDLSDGAYRQVDVALTDVTGRILAVEIAVTNAKDRDYRRDVAAIRLLAVECVVPVLVDPDDLPTAQEILASAEWLWEPYSREVARTRMRLKQEAFSSAYPDLQAKVEGVASSARTDPQASLSQLLAAKAQLSKLEPASPEQRVDQATIGERIANGIRWSIETTLSMGKPSERLRIRADKFGSFLRSDTARRVNKYAGRIHRAGFAQANPSKPTLFSAKLAGHTLYVDLGGTEVLRIWEVECVPAIYAFPFSIYRDALLEAVD